MALLKVADFRTSQDGQSGYVLFKLIQPNGSVTDWIGWQFVPIGALASLQNILNTHNAYYDTQSKVFTTGPAVANLLGRFNEAVTLNPKGIETPIKIRKEKEAKVKVEINKRQKK